MLQLYFAPRTRAVRVAWLLEELALPYELVRCAFTPPTDRFFSQPTPTGKLPTLVDGDLVLCESGAIVETILERYGEGRLVPPAGSDDRARYLQWLHYADSTAFPPLGIVVWLTRYRGEGEAHAALLEDARARAASGFAFLEERLGEDGFVVGPAFTAADVMLGFTLLAGRALGVLDERFPRTNAYLDRLAARPAFQKVAALD